MIATTFFTRAAVLLSAARLVSSVGTAIVHNECDFDVYLWSVSQESSAMQTLKANGGEYSEKYRYNPNGGGISIKAGRDTYGQNITQFEYTLEGEGLWYDLSLINGNPFVEFGVTVVPADEQCNAVICPAGVHACAEAYMVPTDDFATAKCGSATDTVMVLCASEDVTNGDGALSAVVSSAIATASPVHIASHKHVIAATPTPSVFTTVGAVIEAVHATTAAAKVANNNNNNVVIHTTFVTYVVTVEARDAAPEATPAPVAAPAPERRRVHRHEHGQQRRHEHAHAHNQEESA